MSRAFVAMLEQKVHQVFSRHAFGGSERLEAAAYLAWLNGVSFSKLTPVFRESSGALVRACMRTLSSTNSSWRW